VTKLDSKPIKMNDEEYNAPLHQVRHCLMPTFPIEDMFNLTFKLEREETEPDTAGGRTRIGWQLISDNLKGALDDRCGNPQRSGGVISLETTVYAVYCGGNEKIAA